MIKQTVLVIVGKGTIENDINLFINYNVSLIASEVGSVIGAAREGPTEV